MNIFLLFQFIPMPVLYGVFLYMGVASLNGVQVNAEFVFSFSPLTELIWEVWSEQNQPKNLRVKIKDAVCSRAYLPKIWRKVATKLKNSLSKGTDDNADWCLAVTDMMCVCLQFMDRLKLLLMPAKHQPDLVYLRHVPLRKVHLFTFMQILCLALLWILKSTVAAIIFPVMVGHMTGIKIMPV